METIKIRIEDLSQGQEDLKEMGEILRTGGLVAFPTETVYGLGANALRGEAVTKIFMAKGRPSDNPLIVHIAELNDLEPLVTLEAQDTYNILVERFWPGPLTIVFKAKPEVPREVTAGLNTVAVRMPNHPIALELIKKAGVPIAAPSANLSGKPSPITAQHVIEDLDGKIDAIIDGGKVDIGVESTVLDITCDPPLLLRPGGVTLEELREVLGEVEIDPALREEGLLEKLTPRSPGMKYTHYAPEAKVLLIEGEPEQIAEKVKELAEENLHKGVKVGILASKENEEKYEALGNVEIVVAGSRKHLSTVAAGLYGYLRYFDEVGVEVILVEGYHNHLEGLAIMNRLRKASGYNIIKA